jgi:hypothetical protein
LAITNTGGFAAKPDAKAFALSPAKMKTARANNAALCGKFAAQRKICPTAAPCYAMPP